MNKRYTIIFFFLISVKIFSQDSPLDKKSNNMTLDGNLEYVENNLIDAEALYRKAISIDSLNNIASYNLANSFYKGQLNQEAANQYKLSIKKANSRQELHKGHHNLGNVYMQNKDYQNAVNSFKNALLNNPNDDETRYNYVLAKELLKNEQKKNDKKDDKKDDKKEDKKDDKKEDKKNDKKDDKKNDKKDDKKNDKKDKQNKPQENKISPEQLKNLLKAMDNQEKKVQEKVNKNKIKGSTIKNKKDW
jgi:Ca-activated chloride channel family protein